MSDLSNNSQISFICKATYREGKVAMSSEQLAVLVSINCIVMSVGLVINPLVILSLHLSKQLHTISLKLILYISISDFCNALISQPLFISLLLSHLYKTPICGIGFAGYIVSNTLMHFSLYIVALITYDRYARIKCGNTYRFVVTEFRFHVVAIIVVGLSLSHSIVFVIGTTIFSIQKMDMYVSHFIDMPNVISIFVTYGLAFRIIKKYRKKEV